MANKAYICRIRTDIDEVSIHDLQPNTSQRSLIYQPVGQTGYLGGRVENDEVATSASGGDDITDAAYDGLAAYLLDHVESGGLAAGTGALSDSDANDAADAIIAILDAGTDLTLALVNAAIADVAANTELTNAGGSASTGSLADVLKILAGGQYDLPAGSVTETPTGTFNPTQSGSFAADADYGYKQYYSTGALQISCAEGQLSGFADNSFSYGSTTGRVLAVYDQDGNVLT